MFMYVLRDQNAKTESYQRPKTPKSVRDSIWFIIAFLSLDS